MNSWNKLTGKLIPILPDFNDVQLRQLRINTEGKPLFLQLAAIHACIIENTFLGQIMALFLSPSLNYQRSTLVRPQR